MVNIRIQKDKNNYNHAKEHSCFLSTEVLFYNKICMTTFQLICYNY